MKVLLVNNAEVYNSYHNDIVSAPKTPNLTLAVLAGVLLKENFEVKILDLSVKKKPYFELKNILQNWKPDAAGITFYTSGYYEAKKIIDICKKENPAIKTIAGGVHVSAMPDEVLNNFSLDAAVLGEGEKTLVRLLKTWQKGSEDLTNISGIAYIKNGELKINPPKKFDFKLDDIPLPAWNLYKLKDYKSSNDFWKKNLIGNIETSRGCTSSCWFCSSNLVFGKRLRKKSVSRVVEEIRIMLDMGFKEIHIQDDGFAIDLKFAKNICREIIKSKLKFPWELYNGIRIDHIDEEFLHLAADAGCYRLRVGIESGDDNILKSVNKKLQIQKIKNTFKLFEKEKRLEIITLFIMGFPDEKEINLQATIDLACELKADYSRVSFFVPFPGSRAYQELKSNKKILTENWKYYQIHNLKKPLLEYNYINAEILKKYYIKFYLSFYLKPEFIIRHIYKAFLHRHFLRSLKYFLKHFIKLLPALFNK